MSARQVGSELRMLAAGLVLGRLVLRKPRTPEPVVVRIAEPEPKSGKKRASFSGNALAVTVISVVLSGIGSFLVAHYQTQDSDKHAVSQASAGQQAAIAGQVQNEATTLYNSSLDYSDKEFDCAMGAKSYCQGLTLAAEDSLRSKVGPFRLITNNLSDRKTLRYIQAMENDVLLISTLPIGPHINLAKEPYVVDVSKLQARLRSDYSSLLSRCGQLIQEEA
jgi:hypothetical protein